jgi:6-phosphogluconolactonase (cycloisomerase 2 family)
MAQRSRFARLVGLVLVGSIVLAAPSRSARASAPLYVTNWGSNNVSIFRPRANGTLPVPRLVAVGPAAQEPLCAALAPDGRWLYVSNWGSGDVSSFRIGRGGGLRPRGTFEPAAPLPSDSAGIAITPSGRHLYMANFNGTGPGTLSSFTVNRDGSLAPLGATVPTGGGGAAGVALDRHRRTLYVANMTSGDVSTFAIGRDGRPTLRQVVSSGAGAFFPVLTPDGRHLLVANATANTVSSFSVRRSGLLGEAKPAVATGATGPRGIAISPGGRYAYVAHYAGGTGPGTVSVLRIHAGGTLTRVRNPVATGGNGAEAIAVAGRGHLLYVANFNSNGPGSVTAFAVRNRGIIRRLAAPTPTGGLQPDFGGLVVGRP